MGWRPGPLRAWVLDLRSSTITGGDFSSRKRNNCFAKCLTLGSFESVRSYVHFKCAFNVFVGYWLWYHWVVTQRMRGSHGASLKRWYITMDKWNMVFKSAWLVFFFFRKASEFPWLHLLLLTIPFENSTCIYQAHNRQVWGVSNSKAKKTGSFVSRTHILERDRQRVEGHGDNNNRWCLWSVYWTPDPGVDICLINSFNRLPPTTQRKRWHHDSILQKRKPGSERVRNWLKVTQLESRRVRIWTGQSEFEVWAPDPNALLAMLVKRCAKH